MPKSARVSRRCRWFTVSNAADRSSRIRTAEWEAAWAVWRASVTAMSAVSVEWAGLKPDWCGSNRLFCERWRESWLETVRSRVFDRNERSDTGL